MEDLANKVKQMETSMDIIDGYNPNVQHRCNSLKNRIESSLRKLEIGQRLLEEYAEELEYRRELEKQLDELKKKLLYIQKYFPPGIISIDEDEDEYQGLTKPDVENTYGVVACKKNNLLYGNDAEISHLTVNSIHRIESQDENKKKVTTSTPRRGLSEKSNVMTPSLKTSSLPVPKITFSSSKSDTQRKVSPTTIHQEISVSYVENEEFSKVSSYMKGRLTMENINEFIDLFNATLNKKYDLMKKPKKAKSVPEVEQSLIWKEQEKGELVGSYFVTAEDFDKLSSIKIGNKKYSNIITILRHLKRIKEVRKVKLICYVAWF